MRILCVLFAVMMGLFGTSVVWAQSAKGVDKLYVLDCGWSHNADESRWTPGLNVGKPIDMSENCYLIHHAQGYFLWDTGYSDKVASMPDGQVTGGGATVVRRSKTLAAQLAAIGVSPSDIKYVGISHTHGDHTGNVELFPQATLMIQKVEYEAAMSAKNPAIAATHPVMKLEGDKDVFGDGSVTIISTPGHTVGHQSLLVHLPKTGWVISEWRRGASEGQLGQPACAVHECRQREDGGVDAAAGGLDGGTSRAVVDQPRQGAKRSTEARAGILRLGDQTAL